MALVAIYTLTLSRPRRAKLFPPSSPGVLPPLEPSHQAKHTRLTGWLFINACKKQAKS